MKTFNRILTTAALLTLTLASVAQTEVYLRGNIVPNGKVQLTATDGQQYQSEVTLDDSYVFLFSDKYVYFECPSENYRTDNIRINGGTYTVSFNLGTKKWDFTAPVDEYRISAFGSSVCNGEGADGHKGYAWLYGEQLGSRYENGLSEYPFYVSGISIGGNNTQNLLDRYGDLTRNHSRYVIIGLSMGNEGIHESSNKQQTLNQFSTNMQTIIRKAKADGMIPVVMNNYTRGDFTAEDYSYIKQMNLLIHQWDVSSVNTLGAIDDGAGHWASGYMRDNAHPTTNGHKEFFYAMPPSLFDAIAAGKVQPKRDLSKQMTLSGGAQLRFEGETMVHPFTITLRFKGNQAGQLFAYHLRNTTRTATVKVDEEGHVVYTTTTNRTLTTSATLDNDLWHTVTLTHYYAQGRTLLYLDSESAGEVRERINSLGEVFVGDEQADVSRQLGELFFWRAAFSPEEVQATVQGKMLKSSLNLYVPTGGPESLDNLAMSLNTVQYIAPQPTTPTGIHSAPVGGDWQSSTSRPIYNIQGLLVSPSTQRGIFVQDGRKYLHVRTEHRAQFSHEP